MKAIITLLLVLFTSIATFGQTTETRYYNGKYTKETALNKVNAYITQLKSKGFVFNKTEGKSAYQFSGIWSLNNGANTTIEYLVEDNRITVKLIKCTNKGMNLIEIVQDEKHHQHGVAKMFLDTEVLIQITNFFKFLEIENNTTQTNTTAKSTSANNQFISDANTYKKELQKNEKDSKQFIIKIVREQRAEQKTDDQIAEYFYQMYNYLYPTDKETSFKLIYWTGIFTEINKKAKAKMTKEQYKVFSQQSYDNYYNKKQ